jgi:hypothetical protein
LSVEAPEIKKFRAVVDSIKDHRNKTIIQTAYLMAARDSEILTETSPWDLLHGKSKPYGNFAKFQFQDFEISPATPEKPAVMEKVFVCTLAVAKRGKRIKRKKEEPEEEPLEVKTEEVEQALLKWQEHELLKKWKAGEIQIDPLLIKVLLGKLTFKVVALPTSPKFEPWSLELLKNYSKNHTITFNLTRQRFWQICKEELAELLPKKDRHNLRNPLRHWRISHLISYYNLDPYEVTTYSGWTIKSTFGMLGIMASPNIDVYAHLQWRRYLPRLLKPLPT